MYELLKRINKLKKTPRMGWLESDIDISEAEDVAQHSFETASITLVLSELLENEIDRGRALKMAIIHDWAESITGDFSRDMSSQLGEDIKERITDKTKMLMLNSPQNPTGGVLRREDMKAIAEIAEDNDVYILSDEIYSKMLYDGLEHHSPAYLDECSERTILVDGFSKAYSMTGYRLGYAVAPEEVIEEMELLLADAVSCTTSFVQKAGVEALRNSQDFVDDMMEEFSKRRDVLVEGLNEKVPGLSCIYPKGAFYAFPNIEETEMTSEEVADYLLEEAGVCLLPGNKFGEQGEGFLRISYASSLESIEEGIERMSEAMEKKIG